MKKIMLTVAIAFSCLAFYRADAQFHISVGLNIGNQPEWGPVGYDHANYYYMPDIDTYYDVNAHQYVYLQNNVWIHSGALPPRYANYDRYHGYKVVVNDRNPWERAATYRARYAQFRGRHDQQVIRDSREDRYANHWMGDRGRDNRPDQGRGGRDDHRGDRGPGDHRDDRGPDHH